MKAYITCPLTHTQDKTNLLTIIDSVAKESGFETFVCRPGGTPDEIFQRDFKELKSSDVIIAEVSERSHGVGMEIGMSFCLGLKRILLLEKGNKLTKFALGMPGTHIVEYSDEKELETKLPNVLEKIKN